MTGKQPMTHEHGSGRASVRLRVEVVHHRDNDEAEQLVKRMFRLLACDTSTPGESSANIPIRVWKKRRQAERVAGEPQEPGTQRVWVVFADDALLEGPEWMEWLVELVHKIRSEESEDQIIPIASKGSEGTVASIVGKLNYLIRRTQENVDGLIHQLLISLIHFHIPDVTSCDIFISYVRGEGTRWRDAVVKSLEQYPYLRPFYDEKDLIAGASYRRRFENAIKAGAFLAIKTDRYGSREETTHELDLAKKHDRPIIVLDVIEQGESRSYPYMGNCRSIRLNAGERLDPLVTVILREILEFHAFHAEVHHIPNAGGMEISFRPPGSAE